MARAAFSVHAVHTGCGAAAGRLHALRPHAARLSLFYACECPHTRVLVDRERRSDGRSAWHQGPHAGSSIGSSNLDALLMAKQNGIAKC
eukprot:357902-Chlamydomonas_euryale.AAC.25